MMTGFKFRQKYYPLLVYSAEIFKKKIDRPYTD